MCVSIYIASTILTTYLSTFYTSWRHYNQHSYLQTHAHIDSERHAVTIKKPMHLSLIRSYIFISVCVFCMYVDQITSQKCCLYAVIVCVYFAIHQFLQFSIAAAAAARCRRQAQISEWKKKINRKQTQDRKRNNKNIFVFNAYFRLMCVFVCTWTWTKIRTFRKFNGQMIWPYSLRDRFSFLFFSIRLFSLVFQGETKKKLCFWIFFSASSLELSIIIFMLKMNKLLSHSYFTFDDWV